MMKLHVQQQQTVKLHLTQGLTQAITMLQYTSAELNSKIDELSMENPLIERKDSDVPRSFYHKTKQHLQREQTIVPEAAYHRETLKSALKRQALDLHLSNREKRIFAYLVESLDSNGYVTEKLSFIASELSVPAGEPEAVLAKLQSLEPAGVGARSLQECILIQLRRLPKDTGQAETVISSYFELFAKKAWKELSVKTGLSLAELQNIQDIVANLSPRPGLAYDADERDVYIEPDVVVSAENGKLTLELSSRSFPDIQLNSFYETFLERRANDETASFLSEKYRQWKWLDQALRQRRETMTRVMKEIMVRQKGYFFNGQHDIQPLTLKEVADALGIHESTVSRAVKGKTVQTPYELCELKRFFSAKVKDSGDGHTSSHTVKAHLCRLIEQENKMKPLSDRKLADLLKEAHGIVISRRTVAKYRDQLNILPSSVRKRYE
ncbi:RNA polymerase sigma-54 factor [Bacillus glycinifermentans]|uniref:RNA polymerase sigma-54 factor n=2 Tax=Bacillus glycinifermentans TaxID=1664069 RepID=A0A0T6BJ53_9BACI|nr:RNA polymerase sigma-54 factor [Bacillus glycinifermentans]KRT88367.1 RNA polymerase sigma-54 factor [Bacillus glycinifermentans]